MTESKSNSETKTSCSSSEFHNNLFFKGKQTQCFCEQQPEYAPYKCAEENEECQCQTGNQVMFMKKFGEKSSDDNQDSEMTNQIMNFFDSQLYPFTLKVSKGKGEIKCNSQSFDNVDPNPGHAKQCYCAKQNTVKPEILKGMQKFWSAKNKEEKLEQTHVKVLTENEVNIELAKEASLATLELDTQLKYEQKNEATKLKAKEAEDQKRANEEYSNYNKQLETEIKKMKEEASKRQEQTKELETKKADELKEI